MNTLSQIGSKVIRQKAKKVTFPLSKEDKGSLKKLIKTMQASQLVGLAAPQIGISKQLCSIQPKKTEFRDRELGNLLVFINPKITRYSRKKFTDSKVAGVLHMQICFLKLSGLKMWM